jgi:hypothetical protein
MLIFRRSKCIVTAPCIVTLRKQPFSRPVESGLQSNVEKHDQHALGRAAALEALEVL